MPNNQTEALHFVIACCQSELSDEDIVLVCNVLHIQHIPYETLLILAHQHGVLPLVYKTLKKLYEEEYLPYVPYTDTLITEAKDLYRAIAQKNMLMSAELIRMMKLFQANNIEALAFKGPALAQAAYGDITLRQYGDLDILIHRKDFRHIASLMQEKGYSPHYPIEIFAGDKVMFEMNNDCPFYDRNRGLAVEIHWDFFRKLALPTERFSPWENTETVMINGKDIRTLSSETHLLYHALHGAKHVWERLVWIVDIDRFIRSTPDLDWGKTIGMAKNMGAEKMFFSGLALAHNYFHTPLPDTILHRCQTLKLEPFIAYVGSELSSENPASEDSLAKLSKVIGLRDTLYSKTMTLLEFMFRPGINERRTVILPDSLFWLYWIIRPAGMAYRFIVCRMMKLCSSDTKE